MVRRSMRINRRLSVPDEELRWRFSTSAGPGGQHANRSHTVAEVSFDVNSSRSLGPRQRSRLLARLGPVVTARAGDERSQWRNREKALERLAQKLSEALAVERRRVPTAPSQGARQRRLDDKRRRADVKRQRSAVRRSLAEGE